ncbi:MAG: alpha/beta hydrolase [Victivallales bacterium]|nr:alpha/beta hydrolase [Victivallales bacterium]MCF7888658.1 alpha/beta hydrolase [Victivallales bacterium]
MTFEFELGGQKGWCHESEVGYGYFHTYDDLTLGSDTRKIHILLPEDYKTGKKRYPVVYMNDGQTVFFPNSKGLVSWNTDKVVDCLYRNMMIEPVIVVAVYPKDREKEYLYGENYRDFTGRTIPGGGVEEYSDYLAQQLKPFIDNNYYTLPESSRSLIIGSSYGGIASFYTACKYPDRFGMAAALSPSFYHEFQSRSLTESVKGEPFFKKIKEFLDSAEVLPKLWLDWGVFENYKFNYSPDIMLYLTRNFDGYIADKNIFYYEDPFGRHEETSWSYRLNLILTKFYKRNRV